MTSELVVLPEPSQLFDELPDEGVDALCLEKEALVGLARPATRLPASAGRPPADPGVCFPGVANTFVWQDGNSRHGSWGSRRWTKLNVG